MGRETPHNKLDHDRSAARAARHLAKARRHLEHARFLRAHQEYAQALRYAVDDQVFVVTDELARLEEMITPVRA